MKTVLQRYTEFKADEDRTGRIHELLSEATVREAVALLRDMQVPSGKYESHDPDAALKLAGIRRIWEAGYHAALNGLEDLSRHEGAPEEPLPPEWAYSDPE